MKVSVFLFLAAWLLIGCTSTQAGEAERGTPASARKCPRDGAAHQEYSSTGATPTSVSSPPSQYPGSNLYPLSPAPCCHTYPAGHSICTHGVAPPGCLSTLRPSPVPEAWKTWPVVPALSETAKTIYLQGQALGRDPHRFSKIGDCQNITTYFLADFENPGSTAWGNTPDCRPAIDWFKGSFGRKSLAVKGGLNVASVMNPLMADPESCLAGESPLACELRVTIRASP